MPTAQGSSRSAQTLTRGIAAVGLCVPVIASASPFLTGANAIQANLLTWLTPIAIIAIMVLGVLALANRISWGWVFSAILGVAIAFGSPQIVAWVRGMFGV